MEPIFVLCAGRSGSTLLRFLLDAHPDLACPPEARVPTMLGQLAAAWSVIEGSPLPEKPGDDPPPVPERVVAGIRHTLDLMTGPYLARRGKKRYCDKNLGTAHHAGLLMRVFPEARFLCLYRHPMDLIASGIEACPWGLNAYGFEPYIAANPHNTVLALANYWADHTAEILAVEERYPASCHRVRYEDMVADPDAVASGIFSFLAVPPVAAISSRLFTHERERFGKSDYKIWNTTQVTADSVSRGWSIPAAQIPPEVRARINELAGRLGYVPVDADWGAASRPTTMIVTPDGPADGQTPIVGRTGRPSPGSQLLERRLRAGLARLGDSFSCRWRPYSAECFLVAATVPGEPGRDAAWLVDLPAGTVTADNGSHASRAGWRTVGTAVAWEQVIEHGLNLGLVFRRGEMRYRDNGDAGAGSFAADTRVAMLCDLLGITVWSDDPRDGHGETAGRAQASPAPP